MNINPIGTGVSGIAADSIADDSKQTHSASSAQSQGVQTTLSSGAASVEALVAKAMQSPKPRQERVDALRMAVSRSSYAVDPKAIAAAVANHYSA